MWAQKGKNISTSGMRANFTNSIPVSVNTYNVPIMADFSGPVQYEVWDRTNAFYVQDKWKPTKKLVVDVGLRFETDFAWLPPSCSATNVFVDGAVFLGNQRRSGFQDRRAAVFCRLRFEGRRQDGAQVRREPLYQAGLPGQRAASQSSRRCQRHAIVDGVCERARRRDAISTETWCHR